MQWTNNRNAKNKDRENVRRKSDKYFMTSTCRTVLKNWVPRVSGWTDSTQSPARRMNWSHQATATWPLKYCRQTEDPTSLQKEKQVSCEGARLIIAVNFSTTTRQRTRKESNNFIFLRKVLFLTHGPNAVWPNCSLGVRNFHNLNVWSNGGGTPPRKRKTWIQWTGIPNPREGQGDPRWQLCGRTSKSLIQVAGALKRLSQGHEIDRLPHVLESSEKVTH